MSPTTLPAWQALAEHQRATAHLHLRERFAAEPDRFERMHAELNGLLLDYSKNRIGEDTLDLLCRLADESGAAELRRQMYAGGKINLSEHRAVLHTALRLPENAPPVFVDDINIVPQVHAELNRALDFAERLQNGTHLGCTGAPIRDVVNIGIGGSDLGPRMVAQALAPYRQNLNVHFAANLDSADLDAILRRVEPSTTLFIIASKSFRTPETLLNAQAARRWFLQSGRNEADIAQHFAAVSANVEAAAAFGIAPQNVFAMFDWVGGRYSVWSAIGLPVMCAVGRENFREFLRGGHAMDEHFLHAPWRHNIPALLALIGIWQQNFCGSSSHIVIPYSHSLRRLPAHLQQLDMESNGKNCRRDGSPADCATGAAIWGEAGVNCQHAFFQLIHQGTQVIPVDFIVPLLGEGTDDGRHRQLVANAFAQAEALMRGKREAEARAELAHQGLPENQQAALASQRSFSGNRPSNTILVERITPYTLGMILAMYEHKVFMQGTVWGINSFDQWGVEYGKVLAQTILPELQGAPAARHDASTAALIERYRQAAAKQP
ncbi:glucose-6-phosphate isomerase [Eikenella longinqua]|uniref:Glucose-6-phosphate isomerase n=1 Tax=Eikenella longinqua TaxID=1795827 RepID=A0A1A9S2I1_9NEIS|nr:glucose-6-phosphate isomerase [Eikenella longinqua]OAM31266.1 glucose-6-phosphate isomerase [Eikenella longinqua]